MFGSRPDGWWRDRAGARRRLVARLARFRATSGDGVTVVFDGQERPDEVAAGARCDVEVAFAPGGPDAADRVIAARAAALSDPASTTVVTSDRALAALVQAAGVAVLSGGSFESRLSPGEGR